MQKYVKEYGRWIAINVVVWCVARQLFLAIKLWGVEQTVFQSIQLPAWYLIMTTGISGMVDGLVFGIMDSWFDKRFKKISFPAMILIKASVNLSLAILLNLLMFPLLIGWTTSNSIAFFADMMTSSQLIIAAVYFLLITTLMQLAKLVATWMHTSSLLDIMSGGGLVEENRIFLFLDMKSSTRLAELLGAQRYSALIQDCFRDMTLAIEETAAEIYQYVGDEAVLTWKVSEANFQNAVTLYFRFKEIIQQHSGEYQERFGVVPEFKAGVHDGRVVKAQIGVVRKEIAFHGDAINTASRIQSKCGELMCDLLISESVRDQLRGSFLCHWEGKFQLRGKERELNLYSIQAWAPATAKMALDKKVNRLASLLFKNQSMSVI